MFKRIICLVAAMVLSAEMMMVNAASSAATDVYKSAFGTEQGVDGWYFCEFDGNSYKELGWDNSRWRWKTTDDAAYPVLASDQMMPGNELDVGLVFIVPRQGMVNLKGSIRLPYSTGSGDVLARIIRGKKELWSGDVVGKSVVNYDMQSVPVKEGDVLQFRVSSKGNNVNDLTGWWPTVEYTEQQYVPDKDNFLYYQIGADGERKQLEFNEKTGSYIADDGVAYVSSDGILPTSEYSLVRHYDIPEEGRYRVYADVGASNKLGGGNIFTVTHNGEQIWSQLIPAGESDAVDVRVLCKKGDVLELQVSPWKYTGYNEVEWEGDISKFIGTMFCEAGTSSGFSNAVISTSTLDSYIKSSMDNGVEYYSVRREKKYPMSYDSVSGQWKSTAGDDGYISNETARPGLVSDTYIDIKLKQDGMLRITGDLNISNSGDGVLSKVRLNGNVIWSSRVGEERSVRWDEPYDTSYFVNYINTVAEVKSGDILSFSFAKWRNVRNDSVNLKNVELTYVYGTPISETTRWKLDQSVVIDTQGKLVSNRGNCESANVLVIDGTTYISKPDAEKIFGGELSAEMCTEIYGMQYVAVRKVAETRGKNVLWTSGRLAIIYEGLPVLYGYPELNEIDIALKRGELFE